MITTHVTIQKSDKWGSLGKVEFYQLPRIGEIIGHQKDGKAVWFRVINVAHNSHFNPNAVDIYAVETTDPNVP